MDFFMHDSLILALGMLLDFRKAKKHSPIGSCFYYAFRKSRNIPRARIRESCMEIHTVFLYYNITE